ncbi:AAA-ATPase At5g17760 [Linum perenne]
MIRELPSGSSIVAAYLSLSSTFQLFQTVAYHVLPTPVRRYIFSAVLRLFSMSRPSEVTILIEETVGISRNEVFDAVKAYLSTKISPKADRLRVTKTTGDKNITVTFHENDIIFDEFHGLALRWKLEPDPYNYGRPTVTSSKTKFFELTFLKEKKDLIINDYIPYVLEKARQMNGENRVLKLHTLDKYTHSVKEWVSVKMEHPASFETLAMEPALKDAIIRDLDQFRNRREFYRQVGRAWKRGYLLHGPPGTGKSTMVAAMANYLKFDVYDLQLTSIKTDADLRRILMATGDKSILVIEDIDCSCDLPDRNKVKLKVPLEYDFDDPSQPQITLSGLLNFIDGLWSSCGDERIIVFTTNHKEKLDPALLRPGRMDMHIHMSYCSNEGFKQLARNYLGRNGENHRLCGEIRELIEEVKVSPAEVAEELMKSSVADVAMEGVVNMIKRKRIEEAEQSKNKEEEQEEEEELVEDNNHQKENDHRVKRLIVGVADWNNKHGCCLVVIILIFITVNIKIFRI